MIIAFDVDDTLIIPSVATWLSIDTPNYINISVFHWFQEQWHHMIIWSKRGMDYAHHWAEKLWLQPNEIIEKKKNPKIDICFDDCNVDLATINVKVKRFNNKINRKTIISNLFPTNYYYDNNFKRWQW